MSTDEPSGPTAEADAAPPFSPAQLAALRELMHNLDGPRYTATSTTQPGDRRPGLTQRDLRQVSVCV